jgi:quercetin dioxygenase-like cupin family protein
VPEGAAAGQEKGNSMERTRIWVMIALTALVAGAGAAGAQTPAPAAPAAAPANVAAPQPGGASVTKPVLDNPRIRVVEITFRPGAKTAAMTLPDHMLYLLTDGALVFKMAGKTPYEMTFTAGQALWLPAATGTLENAGARTVRALVVSLKAGPRGGRVVKRRGRRVRR